GDAGLQTRQTEHPSPLCLAVVAIVQSERVPQVRLSTEKIESRRHDSADCARRRVHLDLLADDPLVPTEPALPEAVADDQCGAHSRCIVLGREEPAAYRLNAQQR